MKTIWKRIRALGATGLRCGTAGYDTACDGGNPHQSTGSGPGFSVSNSVSYKHAWEHSNKWDLATYTGDINVAPGF